MITNAINPNQHKVATVTQNMLKLIYTDTGKTRMYYSNTTEIVPRPADTARVKKSDDAHIPLNDTQSRIYRQIVYGLKALSGKELSALQQPQKASIIKKHRLALKFLNRWKQRVTHLQIDKLLLSVYPKSVLINKMAAESDYYSDKDKSPFTFKELGISQKMIIEKLIERKLLPANFYEL